MAKITTKAVWIAAVNNIDFPSKPGLKAPQLKAELDAIIERCERAKLNCIVFHVRPCSDALYKSDIYPTSCFLVENQGDPLDAGFDPLEYIVSEAHKRGMELHAWLNPYRITQGKPDKPLQDVTKLAPNNPARMHPEYTVAYPDGKLYYNPALPQVRKLISDGIVEIIKKYDVDGIHFDDYFYPYPVYNEVDGERIQVDYDDAEAYAKFGNGIDIHEWRRENVNKLIEICYNTIKSINPRVKFGISPFAIWKNASSDPNGSDSNGLESYHKLYCDAVAWVKGGYLDYICPQIYWTFGTEAAPFGNILTWWDKVVEGTGVELYVGQGVYRIETWTDKDELRKQLDAITATNNGMATVSFGYKQIRDNDCNCADIIAEYK